MKLSVIRSIFTPFSTGGDLKIDGVQFCYTLEPPKVPADGSKSILHPPGLFQAILYVSPEWSEKRGYPFRVPLLQNVPGFTGIEIHIGNLPKDTKGCTVVGMTRNTDAVGYSEDTFFKLFHRLPETFEVEYTEI